MPLKGSGRKHRAGVVDGVLAAVVARGGSPGRVLAAAGFTSANLTDRDRLIDEERLLVLWNAAAREAGDDAFGLHVGSAFDLSALGVLGYALLNAPTVGAAIRNYQRYGRSFLQGSDTTLERRGRTVRMVFASALDPEFGRQFTEAIGAIGMRILQRLTGGACRPLEVHFRHRRPASTTEHARIFGAPIRFAQPHDACVLATRDLDVEVVNADRHLLSIVERRLEEIVEQMGHDDTWLTEVHSKIHGTLQDGHPTVAAVARSLGASVRTFQRRLADRGAVFRDLVDQARRDLAIRHLEDGEHSLADIAFLLGYSELSAFDRAFRRWLRQSPREYRASRQSRARRPRRPR